MRIETIVVLCIAAVAGVAFAWANDVTGGWATWTVLGAWLVVGTWRAVIGFLVALLER